MNAEVENRILERNTRNIYEEFDRNAAVVVIVVTESNVRFASNMDISDIVKLCQDLINRIEKDPKPLKVYPNSKHKEH